MEDRIMCYVCQDFKINVGHETKWCPKNACKKCGQKGHAQMGCMTGKQNLPMPDEILLKILSYLDIKGQFMYWSQKYVTFSCHLFAVILGFYFKVYISPFCRWD